MKISKNIETQEESRYFFINYQRLRWLVGLKPIQPERQKTQLPFIILAKNLKPILFLGHKRYIKIFEAKIDNLRVEILPAKMT